jgi:RNA polymerase sigma-70 factor (ECF subfamily)
LVDVKTLVAQAQQGDVQAFEKLVLAYQDRLYGLCYRLAGNHADAQDLAQETFVRAYRALDRFRQEADFGTYLHRIAVNLWLNHRKRSQAVLSLDDPVPTGEGELSRQVADNNRQPEQVVEDGELKDLVWQALGTLGREHRAVLVLREMETLSYEEIAAALGVAPGTVKSRLSRARNALKKALYHLAKQRGLELPGME